MADELDIALTPLQRVVFDKVRAAGTAGIHEERVHVALYGNRPDGGPESRVISIHVHNLNARIRRYNLRIKAKHYVYRLENVA